MRISRELISDLTSDLMLRFSVAADFLTDSKFGFFWTFFCDHVVSKSVDRFCFSLVHILHCFFWNFVTVLRFSDFPGEFLLDRSEFRMTYTHTAWDLNSVISILCVNHDMSTYAHC